ncbi:hypothetical protein MTO96_027810 [Rhipicephalus appendiculatus]
MIVAFLRLVRDFLCSSVANLWTFFKLALLERRLTASHGEDASEARRRRPLPMLESLEVQEETMTGSISPHSHCNGRATCHVRRHSSSPSGWRKVRNVVHWSPFVQTYRKYKYPWIQLAGHQGNFRSGTQGTILKKLCGKEESCLKQLMRDPWLRDYVPEFKGRVEMEDCSTYLELQDLLAGFQCPCVMDVKVGLRTYLEEELAKAREKPKLRKDMYEKMVAVDPDEPTPEEHELKAVTKPRYMIWRETISSTASLGFRIEGIKNPDGTSTKDFKTTKSREQVLNAIDTFTKGFDDALGKYLQRLRSLYNALEQSEFFSTHEFIGSSLLFVHDRVGASVWLIDFAKTVATPPGVSITHRQPWEVGNHEDGYLIGLSNLIGIFEELLDNRCGGYSKSLPPEIPA